MAAVALTTELPARMAERAASPADPKLASFYRPELDALRFIAFLAVFFCHALPFDTPRGTQHVSTFLWHALQAVREAGNFGVCLFFMLSSYLITELLRRECLQTKKVHLKAFYVRRSLRIWPLYFSVLLLAVILGPLIPFLHMESRQGIAYLLFVGNWYIVANPVGTTTLSWLWTISVEEQFYVVWPTMAKIGGARLIAIGSWMCLPLSLIAIVVASKYQQHPDVTVWLNSIVQFQFFGVGALLAIFLSGEAPSLSSLARIITFALGLGFWVLASGVGHIKDPFGAHSVVRTSIGYEFLAAGCFAIFISMLGASVERVPGYVLYLGKISYGLYVFHGIALDSTTFVRQYLENGAPRYWMLTPSLFFADRAIALALTIALAALSYKYLETPWLRLKRKFTFIESRAV